MAEISLITPTISEYLALRNSVGWRTPDTEVTAIALKNSLISAIAIEDDRVVGTVRIVGDGAMYFYIQDLIVHQQYQRRGIGSALMKAALQWLHNNVPKGSLVSLTTESSLAEFYSRTGFTKVADILMQSDESLEFRQSIK
ncbi:GNAT family N-acetyltransferase [Sphaerisporangium sp. B11E5]|uniref:GNAT family N-acetyltransferase n=1 Tax=Sphaerisporangium sp. B11E5 TaxID=3153563 RepID=UPI00325DB4A7